MVVATYLITCDEISVQFIQLRVCFLHAAPGERGKMGGTKESASYLKHSKSYYNSTVVNLHNYTGLILLLLVGVSPLQ